MQWVFVGELLPPEYKVLSGIITSFASVSIFGTTKLFPTLLDVMSGYGVYWLFAGIAFSANILYHFFIPETKGKTMLEIRQEFEKKYND